MVTLLILCTIFFDPFPPTKKDDVIYGWPLDITPAPANEFGLKSVLFKKDNVNNGCAPNSNDIEGSKVETCEKNFRYEVSEAFFFIITYFLAEVLPFRN